MDRLAYFQLGLLLLAVPAQYMISKYMATSEEQRSTALKHIVTKAVGFRDQFLSWHSWQKWCLNLISRFQSIPTYTGEEDLEGECPAVEVMRFDDPKGYFSSSPQPRSPRPETVKYRIGQVIKHKIWGYRGVIVGWDPVAKAPDHWLKQMHPADKPEWRSQPNYSILVDTRDRLSPQTTYIPQDNIQVVSRTQVIHPHIDATFESFDGTQYIPRPWLKALYPHD